jgi:signal transduction histidine kinase
LVANAIDASPQNAKIIVHVAAAHDWRNSCEPGIRVTIADQGTGIVAVNRARVFEPFFSTKQNVGTGLGLWVCKSLVEKHGGHIAFHSSTRPGRTGTIFSVFLPFGQE